VASASSIGKTHGVLRLPLSDSSYLRLLEESDAQELQALIEANRAYLARWLPWAGGQAFEDTLGFIRKTRKQLTGNDGFQAAIVYKESIVGVIGYHAVDWDDRSTRIGYWLAEEYQGRGKVTAAVRALVDHALSVWRLNRVEIRAAVENRRSRAIPERLGFRQEGTVRKAERVGDRYLDSVVYAMSAADWQASHQGFDPAATQWVDEPIRIAAYDPAWPARFAQERSALEAAIGDWAVGGIHHIGSTAVPGLDAKPIVDVLVGVESLDASRVCFEPLAGLDYLYAPYRTEEMHWFCKPHPSRRTHHLHLVPERSARFRDELAFRDLLRSNPEAAREYAALKRRLAARFEHDRDAYTEAKSSFIQGMLKASSAHPELPKQ
jgi:GrpB-like predicted nucleotidyltransferase (UPF0157 family)/RimJ/RimL family protein N-acetyltransferase